MIPRHLIYKALIPVADLLAKNYPCQCHNHPDDGCPGEIAEAEEIIRMTLEAVAADIWEQGYRSERKFSGTPNPYRASEDA